MTITAHVSHEQLVLAMKQNGNSCKFLGMEDGIVGEGGSGERIERSMTWRRRRGESEN